MKYLKVDWHHDHPGEPVLLYSELDDQRREVRKVEVFRSGALGFADSNKSTETTGLGLGPIPPIEEIAADPQFVPKEISRAEFEEVWNRAVDARP